MKTEKQLEQTVEALVRNEVLACQSHLVDSAIESGFFDIEDVENRERTYYPDQYIYTIDLDERGEFAATMYQVDEENGEADTIYASITTADAETMAEDGDDPRSADDVACYLGITGQVWDDEDDIEPEYEPQDIFEWWLVGNRLASDLRALGAPILDNDYGIWWGRTETGQGLSCDADLWRVARWLDERVSKI